MLADPIEPDINSPWIERRDDLEVGEFCERYLRPRRPVVLTNALRDWPGLAAFTPEFFRSEFGHMPVKVRGRWRRLGPVIGEQLASSAHEPGPYPCTLAASAELLPYLSPRFACSLPSRHSSPLLPSAVFEIVNHLEMFFGGPGAEFPCLHCDMLHLHAWIAQVYGEKEFTLYQPGQEHLLYVNPQLPWLSTVQYPYDATRYPLLEKARTQRVVLRAGDTLFIPCHTWHTARCLSMSITAAFDQIEASNWREFSADVVCEQKRNGRRMRARALGAYLRLLGPLLSAAEWFGAHRRGDWGAHRILRALPQTLSMAQELP